MSTNSFPEPQSVKEWCDRADQLFEQEKYEEALEALEKARNLQYKLNEEQYLSSWNEVCQSIYHQRDQVAKALIVTALINFKMRIAGLYPYLC